MVSPGALSLSVLRKGSLNDGMCLYEINGQAIEDFGLVNIAHMPGVINDLQEAMLVLFYQGPDRG